MVESVRLMVERNIDLFGVLKVHRNATIEEIRRAYHYLALRCHPDKPKTNGLDFNLIRTAYEILSDPPLRKQYDDLICAYSKNSSKPRKKKPAPVGALQRKLKEKERQLPPTLAKIEKLREDGVKQRRTLEERTLEEAPRVTTSIYDLPLLEIPDFSTSPQFTARLKYKQRPDVDIDESTIMEIMSIFGKIKKVELLESDDHYAYARIQYEDPDALDAATGYDYSRAQKWDGTRVRKLASLLRSCNKEFGLGGDQWTDNPVVNAILNQYVQSVSDKKESC